MWLSLLGEIFYNFFDFFSNTIFNSQDIERFVFLNSCAKHDEVKNITIYPESASPINSAMVDKRKKGEDQRAKV